MLDHPLDLGLVNEMVLLVMSKSNWLPSLRRT